MIAALPFPPDQGIATGARAAAPAGRGDAALFQKLLESGHRDISAPAATGEAPPDATLDADGGLSRDLSVDRAGETERTVAAAGESESAGLDTDAVVAPKEEATISGRTGESAREPLILQSATKQERLPSALVTGSIEVRASSKAVVAGNSLPEASADIVAPQMGGTNRVADPQRKPITHGTPPLVAGGQPAVAGDGNAEELSGRPSSGTPSGEGRPDARVVDVGRTRVAAVQLATKMQNGGAVPRASAVSIGDDTAATASAAAPNGIVASDRPETFTKLAAHGAPTQPAPSTEARKIGTTDAASQIVASAHAPVGATPSVDDPGNVKGSAPVPAAVRVRSLDAAEAVGRDSGTVMMDARSTQPTIAAAAAYRGVVAPAAATKLGGTNEAVAVFWTGIAVSEDGADAEGAAASASDPRGVAALAGPPTGGAGSPPSPTSAAQAGQVPQGPAVAAQLGQHLGEAARAGPGGGRLDVMLSPEELGRLRLVFTPTDAGLSVSVSADRPDTLDLVRRNITLLASDLAEQGFGDVSFEFGASPDRDSRADSPFLAADAITEEVGGETTRPSRDGGSTSGDGDTSLDIRL